MRSCRTALVVGLIALLGSAAARAGAVTDRSTAIPVDGAPFAAALVAVASDWTITLAVDDQQRRLPAADLVVWGAPAEARRGCQVITSAGSRVIGDPVRRVGDRLQVDTFLAGSVKLPIAAVRGIMFQPPSDRLERDRLEDRIRATDRDTDQLLLDNGDSVAGTVTRLEPDRVEFDAPGATLQIDTNRIMALLCRAAPDPAPAGHNLAALLGCCDGTLLYVRSLVVTSESVRAALVCGTRLTGGRPADLVCLQPLGGRVVYLSDLPAPNYRQVPYLTLPWPFRADRNVLGGRLRCRAQLVTKGLGMHTASRIAYRFNTSFRRFEADVAIDDLAGGKGSVVFRVLCHVGGTWKEMFVSPVVRGGDAPRPVRVELKDADAISLLVDYADHGDELDHADWLGARLVK